MTKDITPKPHETDIRTIIDRYMSGETTNEEEATLRTWFRLAGDDMPEEWRPLKALFSFVDEERETAEADTAETVAPADASLHSRKTLLIALRRPRIWISSAVAAAVVAIVMLVPPMNKAFAPEPQNYAVIDGKVYTSQKVINEQVDEAFQTVTVDNEDPFSALDLMQ
ncbi:hypothetical protein [uncultured Prevotella sp.]|uniref:hypothetical protein n=1 Tax=uncultured Prevotella sp. TaxID=159272 RepID=UPI0027E2FB10|nr:hypothetical protein [uncultured Prevotella sp.]